eukprot:2029255-Rhodomonas_salina.1
MKNLREYTVEIKGFSQKSSAASTHIGDEHVMVRKDVLVVPALRNRLFAIKKHVASGHSASFELNQCKLKLKNGKSIPIHSDPNTGMYFIRTRTPEKKENSYFEHSFFSSVVQQRPLDTILKSPTKLQPEVTGLDIFSSSENLDKLLIEPSKDKVPSAEAQAIDPVPHREVEAATHVPDED